MRGVACLMRVRIFILGVRKKTLIKYCTKYVVYGIVLTS